MSRTLYEVFAEEARSAGPEGNPGPLARERMEMMKTIEISIQKGYDGAYGDLSVTIDAPDLTGSEKQIQWATEIRRYAVTAHFRRYVESPAAVARLTNLAAAKAQMERLLSLATTAQEWIEVRDAGGKGADLRALAQRHAAAMRASS